MSKKYTLEMRTRAFELFVQGLSVKKITGIISEEFGINITYPSVQSWARLGKWVEERNKIKNTSLVQITAEHTGEVSRIVRGHMNSYGKLIQKGEEYIDHHPDFKKTIDAVRSVDIGIQGQRKVMSGLVSMQLIMDLITIVREEVHDDEVLQRISAKAAKLASEYAE